MHEKKLCGIWVLNDFKVKGALEASYSLWRDSDSSGMLIYLENGFMSLAINSKKVAVSDADKYDLGIFYTGRYELLSENEVCHQVLQASDPSRIGQELRREFHLKDNSLKIIGEGDFGRAELLWQRSEKS